MQISYILYATKCLAKILAVKCDGYKSNLDQKLHSTLDCLQRESMQGMAQTKIPPRIHQNTPLQVKNSNFPTHYTPSLPTKTSGSAPAPSTRIPARFTPLGPDGNVTSAGWQVTLCDAISHVNSRSGEAGYKLLYSVYLLTNLLTK